MKTLRVAESIAVRGFPAGFIEGSEPSVQLDLSPRDGTMMLYRSLSLDEARALIAALTAAVAHAENAVQP